MGASRSDLAVDSRVRAAVSSVAVVGAGEYPGRLAEPALGGTAAAAGALAGAYGVAGGRVVPHAVTNNETARTANVRSCLPLFALTDATPGRRQATLPAQVGRAAVQRAMPSTSALA